MGSGASDNEDTVGDGAVEATVLLRRLENGDAGAADLLLPLVYEQLRAIAGSYFRGARADHTLQPTALVHEAYLKITGAADRAWDGRTHFCAVAASAMRQILSNHADAKRALKRGGDRQRVGLDGVASPSGAQVIDLIELDDALDRLQASDPRLARIVELCYFGGLAHDQVARVLGISRSTVVRGWRQARAFLNAELMEAD